MDENKDKSITIYYFLKNHQIYLQHCICDLVPYIFENIHRTKLQIEGTVRQATSIHRRDRHTSTKIPKTVTFWYLLRLVGIKKFRSLALRTNEIPLCMTFK